MKRIELVTLAAGWNTPGHVSVDVDGVRHRVLVLPPAGCGVTLVGDELEAMIYHFRVVEPDPEVHAFLVERRDAQSAANLAAVERLRR